MVIHAFTAEQTSKLTGLSARQLRYWAETDFFRPSYVDVPGKPYGRIYSFRDVVGLRTLALLRNGHKVPLQELRKVGRWLEENHKAPWSELRFYVAGRNVYFRDPQRAIRQGANPQQVVMPIEMQAVAAAAETEARQLTQRTPLEIGKVVRHRYTAHNAPVIAGTRIRTEAVWQFRNAGYSDDQILREYPRLTPDDICAAVEYEEQRRQKAS